MSDAPLISVVIPTFRRPEALDRALASVLAHAPRGGSVEVVVVDNDARRTAAPAVSAQQVGSPLAIRYVHEPAAGVANARNAGVAAAKGRFIAFLDDDETATAEWLTEALAVQRRFDADVVFGPVCAALPEGLNHSAYLQRFFSRLGPANDRALDSYYGCGGAFIRREALPAALPFAAERNHTGGEDDLLFGQMQARGARFAWAARAAVIEHPATERLTLAYTLRRAFAYGQGPASAAWAGGPRRWGLAPLWMGWGAVQAVAFGAVAAVKWATAANDRAEALDRAAQGLGKLLWFPPFKIAFYGQA